MALQINSIAPDFEAKTTQGQSDFHEWIGDGWAVLFSHPKDFTPVCTTELGNMAKLKPEFARRRRQGDRAQRRPGGPARAAGPRILRRRRAHAPNYPMIGDTDLKVSKLYNMLPAETEGTSDGRTAADNATVRTVFIIGPDKRIKLMLAYPMTTGRNFDEILRVMNSMQLTARHKVATPVNWKNGDDVIILASVSDEDARKQFPDGWNTLKPYLRIVPQPR